MTKLTRRNLLRLAAGTAALPVMSRIAHAQSYPARPLRWIIGFPPGGGADIVSRIMAPWLAERLGQPVLIENRAGAASNISLQVVAQSPPDGYTLLFVGASLAVNVSLFEALPFNLVRDIAPVSGLIDFAMVLAAHPSLPARNVAELIALAKASHGKINIGSYGIGSTSHVAGELFKTMAGDINMVHVPYRGGAPMMTDLLGGQIQVAIDVLTGALPHIRSGAVRALGCLGRTRSAFIPDVPTIAETVPGYEANAWCGLGAPRGTPPEIIERLNREINAGLADPAIQARLAQVATTPLVYTPAGFGAYVAAEAEKWGRVVRMANIKAD